MECEKIFVVSHTHWDREWYMPYELFRMRLIEVVDRLFELFEKDHDFRHFHLDGQTVIIEDILKICPKYKEKLDTLIADGKLSVGPWYVLPDGFATGSESLIRNLAIGMGISEEHDKNFRKKCHLGYLPDTFSHCSQMPQILKGFGLDYSIIWRGISGEDVKTEFIWEGADKTRINTVHLLDEGGYLNLRTISGQVQEAQEQIQTATAQYRKYAATDHVLLMNGFDHQIPQPHAGKVIAALKKSGMEVSHAALSDYVTETYEKIKREKIPLQVYRGELNQVNRNPNAKFNTILKNCFSSRTDVKRKDFEAENRLVRYAEPLMVMGYLKGGSYKEEFLNTAWKYLLQNHAHDSICGCSIGTVNEDMMKRYEWSEQISSQCAREGMYQIASRIAIPDDDKTAVHLFNTLPFPLKKVVSFSFEKEIGLFFKDVEIYDADGKRLSGQIAKLEDYGRVDNILSREIGWQEKRKITVKTEVEIPAFGYTTVFAKTNNIPVMSKSNLLSKDFGVMENENLVVTINGNGTLDIREKKSGKQLRGCNYFKDSMDIGDLYMYSPPHKDIVTTTLFANPEVVLIENGELSAAYIVTYQYTVPETYNEDSCRAEGKTTVRIDTEITLEKGAEIVKIKTKIHNTAKQHRIRAVFPSGTQSETIMVDSHFDVVQRNIKGAVPPVGAMIETPYNSGAQKRFLLYGDMEIYNKGIQEYEITEAKETNLVEITLLRCVERLGQSKTLKTTVMPGPEYIKSPESQCIGEYEFEYAIGIHNENVNEIAESYLNEVLCMEHSGGNGSLPMQESFFQTDNTHVRVSALKKSDKDGGIIVRLYNPWFEMQEVALHANCSRAELTDFREETKAALEVKEGKIALCIEPKKIVQIKIYNQTSV